jgi:twinkle protein
MNGSSTCIGHEPCPSCGSIDNLARYDDGHAFCFGMDCNHYERGTGTTDSPAVSNSSGSTYSRISGSVESLPVRNISEETCKKYSYTIGEYQGKKCQIASFIKGGVVVGQKIRLKGKDFRTLGDCSGLWGKHLWSTGKKIVITEGEIDALSVAESQNCKYPVVSIPNGVKSAKKAIAKDLKWLLGFEEIILMFDMDPQGQKAATEVAEFFPVGKCKIAKLDKKDANLVLKESGKSAIVDAIWRARVFRPDGIIAGEDTWDIIDHDINDTTHLYPWSQLNGKTLGARRGEIVTFCAGTGTGKSTAVKEIASYFVSKGEAVGYFALEESVRDTVLDFMSIHTSRMLHLEEDTDRWKKEKRAIWEDYYFTRRLYFYDHWGSVDVAVLSNNIRYFVRHFNVGWIVLDHLSIMVSGVEGGDERRLIDNIMTTLRSLAEELNIGMFIVSHLRRPQQGKDHENGKQVSLSDLRGSGSIAQLSDFVIGLERDQQSDGETDVRVLKARYKGSSTGLAGRLFYDSDTGRLQECGPTPTDKSNEQEAF